MKSGLVKSIAALLVGTGFAMAQPPASGSGRSVPRALPAQAARADVSYPLASGQQTYADPNGAAPVESYGGTTWGGVAANPFRFYGSADYLLWNIRNPNLPPVTTLVPAGLALIEGTDTTVSGVTGVEQTQTNLFSVPIFVLSDPGIPNANSVDMGDHNGARLTFGWWLDDEQDLGIEVGGFWLEKLTQRFSANTSNINNQFNLDTGVQDRTFILGIDGQATLISAASIVIPAEAIADLNATITEQLWGAEVNFRSGGYRLGPWTFGCLGGVRYINLKEELNIVNNVTIIEVDPANAAALPDSGVLPLAFSSVDSIRAQNHIVAPQIGLEVEGQAYSCFFNARAKVAAGVNFQTIDVSGTSTVTTQVGGTQNNVGGLLSGSGDQGEHNRTRFSCVPELNLKVGYQVGDALRLYIGYDALYMQHVVRTGQQVDFTSLTTQIQVANSSAQVGVRQPVIVPRDLDVWVQGASFGFEVRY